MLKNHSLECTTYMIKQGENFWKRIETGEKRTVQSVTHFQGFNSGIENEVRAINASKTNKKELSLMTR